MLKIEMHIIPYGLVEKVRLLARIDISNDGTGTKNLGNYDIQVFEERVEGKPSIQKFKLRNFKRSLGCFVLLVKVLTKYVRLNSKIL